MPRLAPQVTPEFEADLKIIMKKRTLKTKSEAVRLAVHETAERLRAKFDYSKLSGLGSGRNHQSQPRFESDDAIWEKT